MSYHAAPEYVAPDDVRCGALVRGHRGWAYDWAKVDHQCPKRANQCRGVTQVCHVHARAKTLVVWSRGRLP